MALSHQIMARGPSKGDIYKVNVSEGQEPFSLHFHFEAVSLRRSICLASAFSKALITHTVTGYTRTRGDQQAINKRSTSDQQAIKL